MRHVFAILAAVVLPVCAFAGGRELWLYYPVNLQVAANVDELQPIWRRAKEAGYTHVLLADSKFAKLGDVPDFYFKNVERVKAIAKELELKLVPAVFPIGYSNDLLWHDPNLAEGLPAMDTPFVVGEGGVARVEQDPVVKLGTPAWRDENIEIADGIATVRPTDANARIVFTLKVPSYRCYRVSVKVRTDGFRGTPEVKALAGEWSLNWQSLGVKPSQDWTQHQAVFNSLDNKLINLYLGIWGGCKGTLQWKDWRIEEVGLLSVLRRPGTPVEVRGENGQAYEEGKDFEPIRDPKAGNIAWPGDYGVAHEPPPIQTKLPQGTRLLVSWYHPAIIYDGQVSACIAEPKLNDLLADQAKRMRAAWGASAAGWMMSHDEFRTLGWCKACHDKRQTPGQMLADNVHYCRGLLAGAPAYVWGDMFDPHHNAVKGPYYLVQGPWTGAWEGLDKDVVVMNWNHDKRNESLKFFADRGHKQIVAGYYDDPSLRSAREWLESAGDEPSVIGYMYTTWQRDYSQMEAFAKLIR